MVNAEMRAIVGSLNRELKNYRNIRVQYSDALTRVDFSRLELINPVDAWHPSVQGHKPPADAAFSAIRPNLAFLGGGTRAHVQASSCAQKLPRAGCSSFSTVTQSRHTRNE
jgi:hypothetical protein